MSDDDLTIYDDEQKTRENIIIHADRLRQSNSQKRELREYAIDIARRINEEIKEVHGQGLHSLETEIPITFTVTHMSNSDSQRIIWYTIIRWLETKTYRVKLKLGDNKSVIIITWLSKEEEVDITHQKDYIASHVVK